MSFWIVINDTENKKMLYVTTLLKLLKNMLSPLNVLNFYIMFFLNFSL